MRHLALVLLLGWEPKHKDIKAVSLPKQPTKTLEVGFSKLGVTASITVPTIYVVGEHSGDYTSVREPPKDACEKDTTLCGLPLHAESGRLPSFNLRAGYVPGGDDWKCDDAACIKLERKPGGGYFRVERAIKVKGGALICSATFDALSSETSPALEDWLTSVCTNVKVKARP